MRNLFFKISSVSFQVKIAILLLLISSTNCSSDDSAIPVADFSADDTEVPAGTTINFMDQSTGEIDIRSWSFPGGQPEVFSSLAPAITYDEPGVYDVTLEVSNAIGSDIETKTGYITVTFEADFLVDNAIIKEGETVFFTDESQSDAVSWNWTFSGGDPTSSTLQDVAVTYNTAGTYDVTLESSDGVNSDTETKTAFITVETN